MAAAKQKLVVAATEQGKLQIEPARLAQLEAQEKATALRELQIREMATALSVISVMELRPAIPKSVIAKLQAEGFRTAADLEQGGWYRRVKGIGPVRHRSIMNWLASAKQRISLKQSQSLPGHMTRQISATYTAKKQPVVERLAAIARQVAAANAEVSRAEWETRQLYIPRFEQFLRQYP
jgi:hypothetical protein